LEPCTQFSASTFVGTWLSRTPDVTVLPNCVAENGFTIVVLLFWSQTPPALSPGPLPEGPALDPE
jgi:hypothetical protein